MDVAGLERNGNLENPSLVSTMFKKPVSGSISHKNTIETETMEMTCGVKIKPSTAPFKRLCLEPLSQTAMITARTMVSPTNSTVYTTVLRSTLWNVSEAHSSR